jgi:hypothetical protein
MADYIALGLEKLPDPCPEIYLEPMVTVKEGDRQIVITYQFPGFQISERSQEGKTFKQLDIPETGFKAEGGRPLLPSLGRYVQIPFNCQLEEANASHDDLVEVETDEGKDFSSCLAHLPIFPAQDMWLAGNHDDPGASSPLQYEEGFYKGNADYPEKIVDVAGPFEIDGYNALLVHVTPFQYNPGTDRLVGYGEVKVTINISPKTGEGDEKHYYLSTTNFGREAFGNFFLNPRRGIELRLDRSISIVAPSEKPGMEEDLLIIYHDGWDEVAERLATWKQKRGLRVKSVPLMAVLGRIPPPDDPGKATAIKNYIRGKRQGRSSRLRYVLLLGDITQIPPSMGLVKKGTSYVAVAEPPKLGDFVTDYYYATPGDPTGDDQLVLPWLALGRIPANTSQEARAMVERIINYEQNPPGAASYYNQLVFAADFEDGDKNCQEDYASVKTVESICQRMEALGFDVLRIYASGNPDLAAFQPSGGEPLKLKYIDDTNAPPDVAENMRTDAEAKKVMKSAIKKGGLIISYRGHGCDCYLYRPRLNIDDLQEIEEELLAENEGCEALPMVFYSVNCLTGQFNGARKTDCFAEQLLKMEKGGVPSLIAASMMSNTWLNNYLFTALFDAIWSGIIPTFPSSAGSYPMRQSRIGDILEYAKLYIPLKFDGDGALIKNYLEMYHVLGDPTLELWRAAPGTIKLQVLIEGSNLAIALLSANGERLSACPMGSVVTIWRETEPGQFELYKRVAPQVPEFTISIIQLLLEEERKAPGPAGEEKGKVISVCYSAPGYRYYEEQWEISLNGGLKLSQP